MHSIRRLLATGLQRISSPGLAAPPFDWASAISIPATAAPFENLGPVAGLVDDNPWIDFTGLQMHGPLPAYIARDPYPLPCQNDREGYHGDRHYDYWLSGLKDYLCIKETAARAGVGFRPPFALFDFGCASGRVLRHFLCQEAGLDLWGADINGRHVEWVRRFLGSGIKVFQNSVLPHLPFEDSSLSMVYALSVFTHIDEFELAWLNELRRVLKKGGLAYLTIHTEHTWQTMNPNRALYHDLLKVAGYIDHYRVTPELFAEPLPDERVVLKWRTAWNNNCSIFHSSAYIKDTWSRFFTLLDIVQEGHSYQDVAVLQK